MFHIDFNTMQNMAEIMWVELGERSDLSLYFTRDCLNFRSVAFFWATFQIVEETLEHGPSVNRNSTLNRSYLHLRNENRAS